MTMVLPDVDENTITVLDFEPEFACEHVQHSWDSENVMHADDGVYYHVMSFCPRCHITVSMIFCGRYVESFILAHPHATTSCQCGDRSQNKDAYKVTSRV